MRRYTELPFLIEYLLTGQLAIPNPARWDDGLDRQRLEEYRRLAGFRSIYACCLAECPETYHHWKNYSKGMNGVCIEFEKSKLIDSLDSDKCRHKSVQYLHWQVLKDTDVPIEDMPFVKRDVFSDEQEFRVVLTSPSEQKPVLLQNIPVTAIRKIILNPWLQESTSNAIFKSLKLLPRGEALSLWRSQMLGPT